MLNTPPLRPSFVLESPDKPADPSCLTPDQTNIDSPSQK